MKSTIELTLCDSSNIAAFGYDFATATLAVKFKGGPGGTVYHYAGVPAWRYEEMRNAESKGAYFARKIRAAKSANDELLFPAILMEAEEDDDEEGDETAPQPEPKPASPGTPQEKETA